jgi:hypothetical protein
LFYLENDTLMAVDVETTGGTFSAATANRSSV